MRRRLLVLSITRATKGSSEVRNGAGKEAITLASSWRSFGSSSAEGGVGNRGEESIDAAPVMVVAFVIPEKCRCRAVNSERVRPVDATVDETNTCDERMSF